MMMPYKRMVSTDFQKGLIKDFLLPEMELKMLLPDELQATCSPLPTPRMKWGGIGNGGEVQRTDRLDQ